MSKFATVAIELIAGGVADAEDRSNHRGNPVLHWNRIATEILPVEAGPVIDSRAMAILHAAVHEAVNGVERPYMPYTADPDWLPLLWTPLDKPPMFIIPPIPDYPSAAADTSAAAAEVLTAHLGDRVSFEITSATLPGATRRFKGFAHAARESGMSRVYGGIHFLHAVEDGFAQGKGIGRAISRMLPPVRR